MSRAVLLNSGGLDSLLVAKMYYDKGWEVHSLYVDYGGFSRERELRSSRKIADKYCTSHTVVEIKANYLSENPKEEHYTIRRMAHTRPIFIGAAASYAHELKIDHILWGVARKKSGPSYFTSLDEVINDQTIGELFHIELITPLDYDSAVPEVYMALVKLHGVTIEEMEETVSCHMEQRCGSCTKCITREKMGIYREMKYGRIIAS